MTGTAFDIIPVNVLTGFLGSGKTTLLRRLLSSERSGETAVLMNEFGAVGIDHLLVGEIAPDIVLLKSGCVCCSIRGELRDAFVQLFSRRQKGDVPAHHSGNHRTGGSSADFGDSSSGSRTASSFQDRSGDRCCGLRQCRLPTIVIYRVD